MMHRIVALAGAVGVLWGCAQSVSGPGPVAQTPPAAARAPAATAAAPGPAAETGGSRPKGRAGNIDWEIVDAIQTPLPEEQATRWDFVVALRIATGGGVRFTRFERGMGTVNQGVTAINAPLRPGDTLYMRHWERSAKGEERRDAFRRYLGADDKGSPITVEVRVPLGPRFGARAAVPASARVAAPPGEVPLPPDLRVVPPGAGTPADLAAFSGVWTGQWDGVRAHVLVVEEIGAGVATVVYAVGPIRDRPASWVRGRARIRRDRLVLQLAYNETITYARGDGGTLNGAWAHDDGRGGKARLARYVASAPARPTDAQLARATTLGAEALTALLDGQYADALPRAQEALAIREQRLGPSHPDVAASLTTLAEIYRAQGKLDDAERLHRRALAIREAQLGRNHPDVAASLNHLAMLHNARATYREAEGLLTRALEIVDHTPGDPARTNRVKAEVLENLAKVYRAQGKVAQAEEAQARAAILWATQ